MEASDDFMVAALTMMTMARGQAERQNFFLLKCLIDSFNSAYDSINSCGSIDFRSGSALRFPVFICPVPTILQYKAGTRREGIPFP